MAHDEVRRGDGALLSAAAPVHVPIPGTADVVEVSEAGGWYPEEGGRQFSGYLVDLQRVEA